MSAFWEAVKRDVKRSESMRKIKNDEDNEESFEEIRRNALGMIGIRVDNVSHPKHYNDHPSGIECIDVAQAFNFNLGNVIKYVWRAGLKSSDPMEDLLKAKEYLQFEIDRITKEKSE